MYNLINKFQILFYYIFNTNEANFIIIILVTTTNPLKAFPSLKDLYRMVTCLIMAMFMKSHGWPLYTGLAVYVNIYDLKVLQTESMYVFDKD